MTNEEVKTALKEIAETARAQRVGPYSPQSDAWMALELVEKLAVILMVQVGVK